MATWRPSVDPMVSVPDQSFGGEGMGEESLLDQLGAAFASRPTEPPPITPYTSPLAAFLARFGAGSANRLGDRYKHNQENSPNSPANRIALGRMNLDRQKVDKERADQDSANRIKAAEKRQAADEKRAEREAKAAKEELARREADPTTPEYARARERRRIAAQDELADKVSIYRSLGMRPPGVDKPEKPEKIDSKSVGYSVDTASRVITAIDEILPKIGGTTAGIGSLARFIPGSAATNVSAELETIVGNIAFNALQQMRDASKTGGALGAISERELALLSGVEGALRQDQSPDNLRRQLVKVKESLSRWRDAATAAQGGTAPPAPGRKVWARVNGKLVQVGQ